MSNSKNYATDELRNIGNRYESILTGNVLPFWLEHGMDKVNGGIYTGLGEDGALLESDKSVWFQGRALWTFSTAYLKYGKPEYLEAADSLARFLEEHCFDDDGRMFFRVTADGKPVVKRLRYFFSETFAIIGFSVYAKASGKPEYVDKALRLLEFTENLRTTPGILIPKMNPENRPSIAFGGPMILLNVLSEVRDACPERRQWCNMYMDKLLKEVETYFVRPDMKLVLEQCAPDGSFQKDHFEGRLLNPGHAIEGAWFIMNEGIKTGNDKLKELGLTMLDWEWDIGWDEKCGGGIIQYADALGLPLQPYHGDMKFWWPQCEAAIATLMAYYITGDGKWFERFRLVDDYTKRFLDEKNGEWYGYFHRDGTLSTPIKGDLFKGPFHVPRMYMKCLEIIGWMLGR